jgi:hypothetical protein
LVKKVLRRKEMSTNNGGMYQPVDIEPIEEQEPYIDGQHIDFIKLTRRIQKLENKVNELIDRISKSKKVKDLKEN